MIPLPPPGYMEALARLVYSVTYLEGLVIWDVASVSTTLPPEVETRLLVGKLTGSLGHYLVKHSSKVGDVRHRDWIDAAGSALVDVAEGRNDVLHARPITTLSGDQQLQRFHWTPGPPSAAGPTWVQRDIPIDERALRMLELRVQAHVANLAATRFL